ncbi:hypothetical protein M9H77_06093 [Catharanthus roseus]|uniref:Uncharacterized protein n=1 Tax=Catharanthus roseus TaxID=4058 RepID=A0ACC0BR57_CATRO|nr:hypothetical protein M9H77_06093 [Catharanthus roseus]
MVESARAIPSRVNSGNYYSQYIFSRNEYYTSKARITREDVFLLFCPPWLSSFEHSYLWLTGFRPLLAFRLISTYDLELSEDQSQRINSLQEEIKREMQQLTDICARAPTLVVALAEDIGHVQNGITVHLDSTMDIFKTSMEALVQCADYLRRRTLVKILEILSSSQVVKFLATVIQYQLSIRRTEETRGFAGTATDAFVPPIAELAADSATKELHHQPGK